MGIIYVGYFVNLTRPMSPTVCVKNFYEPVSRSDYTLSSGTMFGTFRRKLSGPNRGTLPEFAWRV
jgi:hypothetical protein